MAKYVIVVVVIIIALLFIRFFVGQGGSFFNQEFTELGDNLSVKPEMGVDKSPSTNTNSTKKMTNVTLNTNMGSITIEFFESQAPKTVANFIKLAGEDFYNGVKFHRVIKGFMIQGGDPLTKDDTKASLWGTGGPGYSFADELGSKNKNDVGTISMANSGPNTNGSQFFINTAANNFLDGKHTVFGKVVSGMEVVTKIENTPTGTGDKPVKPVIINSITLK